MNSPRRNTALAEAIAKEAGDAGLGDAVCTHLARVHPTIEVIRYSGGPSGIPLQVGVE